MSERTETLCDLLDALRAKKYHFITSTPATHKRVLARNETRVARDLRDALGWSLPFAPDTVGGRIFDLLHGADLLEQRGQNWRSLARVSSLDGDLFLHSAFPTTRQDSVFFGPDTYRFAKFLKQNLPEFNNAGVVVDLGAGSGAGAVVAARHTLKAALGLVDINPAAIDLARANWRSARVGHGDFFCGDGLSCVPSAIDVIIANPPYIADGARRAYRDGGGAHGAGVSLQWALDAARRLESGGAFLLYTGSAIVGGRDALKDELHAVLHEFDVRYEEIDPDVFGEELERDAYADVERIAVVGVVAVKR